MGLKPIDITAAAVAASAQARLDVRYHRLAAVVRPILNSIDPAISLSSIVESASNGTNLPAIAYADDLEDADALYVSVGALSQFALRPDACTPLLVTNGLLHGTKFEVQRVATASDEALLTRSGTPGIAWPGLYSPADRPTIPSGFVIRLRVPSWSTTALAAILNHPVWRLNSLALSAGKRQDNISQGTLAEIPLPKLSSQSQSAIAEIYSQAIADIEGIAAEDRLALTCDRILSETTGLVVPGLGSGSVAGQVVSLRDVASAPAIRADNRWHGVANRVIREVLAPAAHSLGETLASLPAKGRQPTYLDEPDGDGAFAVATSTIQMGQVVLENAKPVASESIIDELAAGQLLVAMDGDGSIGKAAVVPETDLSLTRDSHVAKLDVVGGEDLAFALACWLNSTWGLVQTAGLMTGATGQTQLRPVDLAAVLVSDRVLPAATEIADQFRAALSYVDTPPRRARRIICDASAKVSELLLSSGAMVLDASLAGQFADAGWLWDLLERAYPSMRNMA